MIAHFLLYHLLIMRNCLIVVGGETQDHQTLYSFHDQSSATQDFLEEPSPAFQEEPSREHSVASQEEPLTNYSYGLDVYLITLKFSG